MQQPFYCIERPAGGPPNFYPHRQPSWRLKGPGFPWTTDINEAVQFSTRELAQAALEAENWHTDASAGICVTEHAYCEPARPRSKLTMTLNLTPEEKRKLYELTVREPERTLIDTAREIFEGLFCAECDAVGADMAAKCCRDADCMPGWNGIHADAIKGWLDRAANIPRPIASS